MMSPISLQSKRIATVALPPLPVPGATSARGRCGCRSGVCVTAYRPTGCAGTSGSGSAAVTLSQSARGPGRRSRRDRCRLLFERP
jgi:hypothetical protein